MKKPYYLAVLVLITVVSSASHAHDKHCKDTELGGHMDDMQKALKQLVYNYKAKQINDLNSLSQEIRQGAQESLKLSPLKLHEVKDHQQAAWMTDYQKGIQTLLDQLDALDIAIANKDHKAIQQTVTGINQHSKKSHKRFRMDCD